MLKEKKLLKQRKCQTSPRAGGVDVLLNYKQNTNYD